MLVVVLAGLAAAFLFLARPGASSGSTAGGPVDDVLHKIAWRLEFYAAKATGQVPQLSWLEVIQGTWPGDELGGTWPGSHFITGAWVTGGSSLSASIVNPLDDPESVAKGKVLFRTDCAPCHGNDGRGGGHAPSLAKKNYSVGTSDFALYRTLRDGIPGTAMAPLGLSVKQRWQLVAYLRSLGQYDPAGTGAGPRVAPVDVTWPMIETARHRTDQWLTYSGGLDGQRHSPLAEINARNVSGLKLLWAHQFHPTGKDPFEATPIVAGKTIFMTEPPAGVAAISAETGEEIWHYERALPDKLPVCCGRFNRGLAILGQTLFWGTLDDRLIAIDAVSGRKKWEAKVADPRDGYTITVAPLVVRNLVIVGIAGGEFGIRGFLAAYDARTGKRVWRFDTIPGPGQPGHDTWKNDAWKTGGGPTWVTGSYDPQLGLLYWGVGNPSPDFSASARPGDNLFTDSVVALDAMTGKLAWYFQFTPNDGHDWDSNQTPILADMEVDGTMRKTICWANRNGFYYVLDRTNGKFLKGVPFVKVTWASGLDATGRPIKTKNAKVTPDGVLTSPWVGGGVNWPPSSYDPGSRTFFVQATEGASIYTTTPDKEVRRGQDGIYGGSGTSLAEPAMNVVKALDAPTGTIEWEHKSPRPAKGQDQSYSGILTTDGGVLFAAYAGTAFALDSRTGKELWRAGLGGKTQAPPITFELDGKQVVAVTGGGTLFLFGL